MDMLEKINTFIKKLDTDTKLTIVSLIFMFVTWVIDFIRNPETTNQLFFPLLVLFMLAMYFLLVSEGLRQEKKINSLLEKNQTFLGEIFPDVLMKKIQARDDLSTLGISRVHNGRDDNLFLNNVSNCKHNLSLLAISLYQNVTILRSPMPMLLANKNINVRILIAHPSSAFLDEKEREEKLPGRIKAEIVGVEGMLKNILLDAIDQGYKGKFEVRYYKGMTYCSMYIFDNEKIWYNPYLRKIPGKDVLVFEIEKNGSENRFFKNYIGHFDAIWNDENTISIIDSDKLKD
jgi:hypothetical protein